MKIVVSRWIIILFMTQYVWTQQIAITIDDSPGVNSKLYNKMERCQLIIQELKKAEVNQVVFFCIGKRARKDTEILQMYSNAGHLIANHSFHHWDYNNKDTVRYTKDILKAESVLGQIPAFKKWYRSPYLHDGETGEKREYLYTFLKQHGYMYGYVTIDTYEFYINHLLQKGVQKGKQFNRDNLRKLYVDHMWKAVLFYDGVSKQYISQPVKHTILLHDNDVTAMFVKDLVEYLRNKGCAIITPQEAYTDMNLKNVPDLVLNDQDQGRVIALAKAKGYTGPFRSEEENKQVIENKFKEYNIWIK